jgi:hypothetical protein
VVARLAIPCMSVQDGRGRQAPSPHGASSTRPTSGGPGAQPGHHNTESSTDLFLASEGGEDAGITSSTPSFAPPAATPEEAREASAESDLKPSDAVRPSVKPPTKRDGRFLASCLSLLEPPFFTGSQQLHFAPSPPACAHRARAGKPGLQETATLGRIRCAVGKTTREDG